mmetsp:Transcript_12603/g.34726  ORF Transcript_12603/g.34726 Transcript_12603/m.34726 type:complete len:221 (-) Transcript_12603:313-975(-)
MTPRRQISHSDLLLEALLSNPSVCQTQTGRSTADWMVRYAVLSSWHFSITRGWAGLAGIARGHSSPPSSRCSSGTSYSPLSQMSSSLPSRMPRSTSCAPPGFTRRAGGLSRKLWHGLLRQGRGSCASGWRRRGWRGAVGGAEGCGGRGAGAWQHYRLLHFALGEGRCLRRCARSASTTRISRADYQTSCCCAFILDRSTPTAMPLRRVLQSPSLATSVPR